MPGRVGGTAAGHAPDPEPLTGGTAVPDIQTAGEAWTSALERTAEWEECEPLPSARLDTYQHWQNEYHRRVAFVNACRRTLEHFAQRADFQAIRAAYMGAEHDTAALTAAQARLATHAVGERTQYDRRILLAKGLQDFLEPFYAAAQRPVKRVIFRRVYETGSGLTLKPRNRPPPPCRVVMPGTSAPRGIASGR